MRMSRAMLREYEKFRQVADAFALDKVSAVEYLEAHTKWNEKVKKFEEEISVSSNFGSW